jgi:Spy/CpxP family protein refolding chaperone
MKTNLKIVAGAVAVVALTAAGLSLAQPGGMGYGMGPGYGMHGWMGAGMGWGGWTNAADAEAALATRLAALKSELKITAKQQAAWAAFEAQAKQQVTSTLAMQKQIQEQMHGPQAAEKSPADFAAAHEAMFKLRQANFEARATAVKNLYAVLTPDQKAVADRSLGGPTFGAWQGCGNAGGYGPGPGPGMGGGRALN